MSNEESVEKAEIKEDKIRKYKTNFKKLKSIVILQAIIMVYTLSTVAAKFAAKAEWMSIQFFICYGIEILILGIYAILWQQIIKKFDISVAYANKAMSILWSLIWAVLFFNEVVTIKNIIGVIIVIIGTIVLNSEEKRN